VTAIAYRDGVMAADTQCTTGHIKWHSPKIAKHKGYLLGAAGNPPSVTGLIRWYFQALGKPTRPKLEGYEFDLLVVTPKGRIELWDQRGQFEPIRYRFWAVGCGAECCLAAMDMGASAPRAVRAAIKFADHCGGRVTTCKL
jgi:hypothetical protein